MVPDEPTIILRVGWRSCSKETDCAVFADNYPLTNINVLMLLVNTVAFRPVIKRLRER